MPALDADCRAGANAAQALYVFAVRAAQDPQVMLRVAGLFAQRNIVPRQMCCRQSGTRLLVDVEAELDSPTIADLLLEKLRSMVLIERASLVEGMRQ